MFFGAMTAFGKDFEVDLKPGHRYKVTGVENNGACDMNLSDIDTGPL